MKFIIFIFLFLCIIIKLKCKKYILKRSNNVNSTASAYQDDFYLIRHDKIDLLNHPSIGSRQRLFITESLLFVSDREKSMKSITGSIELQKLISRDDSPETGNCCSRVSSTYKTEREIQNAKKMLICFKINGLEELWEICSEKESPLYNFKRHLLTNVIISNTTKINKSKLLIIFDSQLMNKSSKSFSWRTQSLWNDECNGLNQSPINLIAKKSKKVGSLSIDWKYGFANNPKAIFNGNEMEIQGNFGKLLVKRGIGIKELYVYKIIFKFPSEHSIDDKIFDGEVEIYHEDENKEKAILSILLSEDLNGNSDLNGFIIDLDPELWNFKEMIMLNSRPNLHKFFKIKKNKYIKNSFFAYMGSDTSPPCQENIQRFILKDIIKIPSIQFKELRRKSFKYSEEIDGNSRKRINDLKNNRIIYYNDYFGSQKCNEIPNDIEIRVNREIKRKKKIFSPQKIVRLWKNATSYSISDDNNSNLIIGDINNKAYIDYIKPEDVDPNNIIDS